MSYQITRLQAEDFNEAIDFINLVFSMHSKSTNFLEILPTIYKPTEEHMKNNYVIKINGKIKALVGIYPNDYNVGNVTLKMARIGAVSTHPFYRNHGLMQNLLSHCLNIIKEEYDIGFLSGLRHRYKYIGFEKCGYLILSNFNKNNLKHNPLNLDSIKIKHIVEEDKEIMKYFLNLHNKQLIHSTRNLDDFFLQTHNWNSLLYGIYKNDNPVGYFISNTTKKLISEIISENPVYCLSAIQLFLTNQTDDLTVCINPLDKDLIQQIGLINETMEINGPKNFSVYNWEKVVSAFMNVKSEIYPLPDGKVILGVKNYGNISISVNNNKCEVYKTNEDPIITLEPTIVIRILFGPLPPSMILNLPSELNILNHWCPLPLYMNQLDFA